MRNTLIISAFLLSIVSFHTKANDEKVLPGAACAAVVKGTESLLSREDGTIKNASSSIVTVVCPLITDDMTEKALNKSYLVLNSKGNSSCSAIVASRETIQKSTASINTSGTTVNTFSFPNDIVGKTIRPSFYIECNLNPSAVIYELYWSE